MWALKGLFKAVTKRDPPGKESDDSLSEFPPEEDQYLRMGLECHGFGNWTAILRDPDFHFQKGQKSNSLLNCAARKFKKY